MVIAPTQEGCRFGLKEKLLSRVCVSNIGILHSNRAQTLSDTAKNHNWVGCFTEPGGMGIQIMSVTGAASQTKPGRVLGFFLMASGHATPTFDAIAVLVDLLVVAFLHLACGGRLIQTFALSCFAPLVGFECKSASADQFGSPRRKFFVVNPSRLRPRHLRSSAFSFFYPPDCDRWKQFNEP